MRYSLLFFVLILVLLPGVLFPLSVQFRAFDHPGYTRVVLESSAAVAYKYRTQDRVIVVDIQGRAGTLPQSIPFGRSSLIERVNTSLVNGNSQFEIHLRKQAQLKKHFVLEKPYRLVFDLVEAAQVTPQVPLAPPKEQAVVVANPDPLPTQQQEKPAQTTEVPTPPKETPLAEPLRRIETICIDPGHGGEDLGAVGSGINVYEKDISLKISIQLKNLIERRLGLRVIMTRETDTDVSLNSRVAKANNEKAQLFVSIHTNSDYRRSINGPETFYVSLKATDKQASELAQKENISYDEIEQSTGNDELKMILWNMAQTEYIQESSQLAVEIQEELNELLNTNNRGVKQAPFRVLMRAAMPAVLVEVAFLSNPGEAAKLKSDSFQLEAAQAIYKGIYRFIARINNSVPHE